MPKFLLRLLTLINLLLYFTVVGTWLALPQHLTLNLAGSAAAICLSLILLYRKRGQISLYLRSHQARAWSSSLFNIFLVFSVLGLINYLAFKHPWVKDFSEHQVNTLTTQSQKVVQALPVGAQLTLFERPGERARWLPILEIYRQANPELSWQLVDPDLRPEWIKNKKLEVAQGLLLEYQGRQGLAKVAAESEITTAMLKIMRTSIPRLGFIQGHGERDPYAVGEQSLAGLKLKLQEAVYQIETLELATLQAVPDHYQALVLWGPQTSLWPQELALLETFHERGGHLIVALDPQLEAADQHRPLRQMLARWGILVHQDLVLDQIGHVAGATAAIPIIKKFNKEHPVTRDLSAQLYFPLTASVEKAPGEYQVTVLAQTNSFPAAWAEKSALEVQKGQVSFHPGVDQKGPIGVLAVASSDKAKLAVFGNSTFLTDQYLSYGGNTSLFLNLVEWMLGEEKFIADQHQEAAMQPLLLGETELGALFYLSVVLVPLLMFGLAIYRYRRSSGG